MEIVVPSEKLYTSFNTKKKYMYKIYTTFKSLFTSQNSYLKENKCYFIQQGCTKLIKSDSFFVYIVTKYLYFK